MPSIFKTKTVKDTQNTWKAETARPKSTNPHAPEEYSI